jgi:uncharacterized protein YjbI with pentapeptide repeats
MPNPDHITQLAKGVAFWNAWCDENPVRVDLSEANLRGADLRNANLSGAYLNKADLNRANLTGADLGGAYLRRANLAEASLNGADLRTADLRGADFRRANLVEANLKGAELKGADLRRANLVEASLDGADLQGADLRKANLANANLDGADLQGASLVDAILNQANLRGVNLTGAYLSGAYFNGAHLRDANLSKADLRFVLLKNTDLIGANLTGCRIHGVSVWGAKLDGAKQRDLIITPEDEPEITVDNIEVAQFVYLLLHDEKIRDVIDTIGKKGVLLLGRFTEGRIRVLERLREKLRGLGYIPMVFNFHKPDTKNFTETVRLLANLSHFVIVDISNPRSSPLELQATVPDYMVPFVLILEEGQDPFAMFVDLQIQYDWVLEPVLKYSSIDRLIEAMEDKIIKPAEAKFNQLLSRRTKQLRVENI